MIVNELLLHFTSLKGRARADTQQSIDSWLEHFDLTEWKTRNGKQGRSKSCPRA